MKILLPILKIHMLIILMTSLIHFWNLQAIKKTRSMIKKKIDDASTHEKKRNLLLYTIYKPITWYIILLQTNINFFRDKFLASNYNRFKIPYLKVYQLLFWCIIPHVVFELAKKKFFAHPDYRYIQEKYFFQNVQILTFWTWNTFEFHPQKNLYLLVSI